MVGSGIAGLSCAHFLCASHDVIVFESAESIGGHTATFDVALGTRRYAVDTGFIVFNDRNYPNFLALLEKLNVPIKTTSMGFSVSEMASGLEYSGTSLDTIFAQRRNIFSWSFLTMLKDILRFNYRATNDLRKGLIEPTETLASYLRRNQYGKNFAEKYLVAMGSAIWSGSWNSTLDLPALFFISFFYNHGLLSLKNRPQWYVVQGGSREYLVPLTEKFEDKIFTNCPVKSIARRSNGGISIHLDDGTVELFDQVVIATHSDQALSLLQDPCEDEIEILGAIPYHVNEVVLHTDTDLLPKNPKTWCSWNYRLNSNQTEATVTYNMNILQGINAPETFCITLNDSDSINSSKILGSFSYHHPVFSSRACQAQEKWTKINGVRDTWFCGAYWGSGFHEDGVNSALKVAKTLLSQHA